MFNKSELKGIAETLQGYGRNGDTILAHIMPEEAALLKKMGGSGTRNPVTGLPEFFGPGGQGEGGAGTGSASGGSSSGGSSSGGGPGDSGSTGASGPGGGSGAPGADGAGPAGPDGGQGGNSGGGGGDGGSGGNSSPDTGFGRGMSAGQAVDAAQSAVGMSPDTGYGGDSMSAQEAVNDAQAALGVDVDPTQGHPAMDTGFAESVENAHMARAEQSLGRAMNALSFSNPVTSVTENEAGVMGNIDAESRTSPANSTAPDQSTVESVMDAVISTVSPISPKSMKTAAAVMGFGLNAGLNAIGLSPENQGVEAPSTNDDVGGDGPPTQAQYVKAESNFGGGVADGPGGSSTAEVQDVGTGGVFDAYFGDGSQETEVAESSGDFLAALGRKGDSELAHLSPQSSSFLDMIGGSATTNPNTGLVEFYNPSLDADTDAGVEAQSGITGGTDQKTQDFDTLTTDTASEATARQFEPIQSEWRPDNQDFIGLDKFRAGETASRRSEGWGHQVNYNGDLSDPKFMDRAVKSFTGSLKFSGLNNDWINDWDAASGVVRNTLDNRFSTNDRPTGTQSEWLSIMDEMTGGHTSKAGNVYRQHTLLNDVSGLKHQYMNSEDMDWTAARDNLAGEYNVSAEDVDFLADQLRADDIMHQDRSSWRNSKNLFGGYDQFEAVNDRLKAIGMAGLTAQDPYSYVPESLQAQRQAEAEAQDQAQAEQDRLRQQQEFARIVEGLREQAQQQVPVSDNPAVPDIINQPDEPQQTPPNNTPTEDEWAPAQAGGLRPRLNPITGEIEWVRDDEDPVSQSSPADFIDPWRSNRRLGFGNTIVV